MKLILVTIIGILLWQSPQARQFTADTLRQSADIIDPNDKPVIELEF